MKNTDFAFDYELLDCGNGKKWEQFGEKVLKRGCQQAFWKPKNERRPFDAAFVKHAYEKQWNNAKDTEKTWNIRVGALTVGLELKEHGQIGIFPEQWDNWTWMAEKIVEKAKNSDEPVKILNLFAYTGVATLFCAQKNTMVTHLDASKASVSMARRNAELSDLKDAKIRWICDDAMTFLEKEARRGNKYDAIILDPPTFGRAGKKTWNITTDLPKMFTVLPKILTENPLFVLLTCHTQELDDGRLCVDYLESIPQFSGIKAENLELFLRPQKGKVISAGFGAKIWN